MSFWNDFKRKRARLIQLTGKSRKMKGKKFLSKYHICQNLTSILAETLPTLIAPLSNSEIMKNPN